MHNLHETCKILISTKYQASAASKNPSLQAPTQNGAVNFLQLSVTWRCPRQNTQQIKLFTLYRHVLKLWASSKIENLLVDSCAMATALIREGY